MHQICLLLRWYGKEDKLLSIVFCTFTGTAVGVALGSPDTLNGTPPHTHTRTLAYLERCEVLEEPMRMCDGVLQLVHRRSVDPHLMVLIRRQ